MPKLKPNKGLLKRVRITGTGRVKFKRANSGHLMSHKSGDKCRQLRQKRLVSRGDIRIVERMLHRSLKPGSR